MKLPALLPCILAARVIAADAPDFTRDVRAILSQHCFKCHGPDDKARKGKLRLDLPDVATQPAKSGEIAIVPGKVEESELLKRINSTDDDVVFPALLIEQATLVPISRTQFIESVRPQFLHVYPEQANPIDVVVRNLEPRETSAVVQLQIVTGQVSAKHRLKRLEMT